MHTSKKGLTGRLHASALFAVAVAIAGLALAACGSSCCKTVALTQTDNGRTVALALSYVGRTPKVVQRFAVNVTPG